MSDGTNQIPDAMGDGTQAAPMEHFSTDDLPAKQDNTPHTSPENTLSTGANSKNQAEPPETVVDDTLSGKIASGGAGSSLDLTDERDRGLIRSTITRRPRRWAGVTDQIKAEVVAGLGKALGAAVKHIENGVDVLDAAKVVASVGKTFEALEGQCQKDEHRAEDHDRLDKGKLTGAVKLYAQDTPIDMV
jgi:hypothetical protein